MPRKTRIQLRRDTASNWSSVNPTLSSGEIGYETDTNYIKIGDGSTAWNTLKYATVLPSDSRLTNARVPTAHASTHGASGTDPITITTAQVTGLDTALSGTAGFGHTHDLGGSTITGNLPESKGGTGSTTGAGLVPIIPTRLSRVTTFPSVGDTVTWITSTPTTSKVQFAACYYVNIGGLFTSAYSHYRVLLDFTSSSTSVGIGLVNSSTPSSFTYPNAVSNQITANNAYKSTYYRILKSTGNIEDSAVTDSATSWAWNTLNLPKRNIFEFQYPFEQVETTFQDETISFEGNTGRWGGVFTGTASADGLILFNTTLYSNYMSGTISVFGYNNI